MALGLALAFAACSVDSPKSRYILAEKLWNDGNYSASVAEFEKVVQRDPRGKLGLRALYRAATTQTLYLGKHAEAVKKFRRFIEASPDANVAWEAEKQIGDILFSKLEQYDQAITFYRGLIEKRPNAPEVPEFQFRVAKALFFSWRFEEAIAQYRELMRKQAGTPWAEKAAFEIGVSYFTQGEHGTQTSKKRVGTEVFQDAIDSYERFLKKYPQSQFATRARFGIGSCLEEMDQLDAAYHQYEALLETYPSPNVIKIKLARIKERKLQRSR